MYIVPPVNCTMALPGPYMYMCMYLPCGVQERMHSLTLNFKLHFCMYTVYLRSIFVRILLTPHLSQGGGLVTTMHILACVPNQVLHCFAWSRIWENGRLHAMHQISTVFKLHTTTKRHLELASLRHYYWFITTQVLKQILSSSTCTCACISPVGYKRECTA